MKMATSEHPSHSECTYDFCAISAMKIHEHSHVVCPAKNIWPCGCVVEDHYAPIKEDRASNYGVTFKSRCSTHAQKVDSRKADASTAYAFTLTMPPDYEPKKPIDEVARLILENGITSKPYDRAAQWAYVVEHTESGTPHIHGMYKTPSGRRIEQKYFKRYWPLWDEKIKLGHGFKGGYHQKARDEQCYDAYIQKEGCVHRNKEKGPSPPPELISHE